MSKGHQKPAEPRSDPVVELINAAGRGPVVLVCEHASCFIPEDLHDLGLDEAARQSHVAWDPGALQVARAMSDMLDAPLVASCISRLVYDCNRAPEEASAMPARSEIYDIPGNVDLLDAERQARIERYYLPFQTRLASTLKARMAQSSQQNTALPVLVTIHSFTRVYNGAPRDVEIGILHDADTRLADELVRGRLNASAFDVRANAPYGPDDGVTHTLKEHGTSRGLANVMIEIRNDLIADQAAQQEVAQLLSCALRDALDLVQPVQPAGTRGGSAAGCGSAANSAKNAVQDRDQTKRNGTH